MSIPATGRQRATPASLSPGVWPTGAVPGSGQRPTRSVLITFSTSARSTALNICPLVAAVRGRAGPNRAFWRTSRAFSARSIRSASTPTHRRRSAMPVGRDLLGSADPRPLLNLGLVQPFSPQHRSLLPVRDSPVLINHLVSVLRGERPADRLRRRLRVRTSHESSSSHALKNEIRGSPTVSPQPAREGLCAFRDLLRCLRDPGDRWNAKPFVGQRGSGRWGSSSGSLSRLWSGGTECALDPILTPNGRVNNQKHVRRTLFPCLTSSPNGACDGTVHREIDY